MLVNCPECHSPVFVRAAAVEQRKPQRCYACKAQLLVDPDGAVEVAVSGKLAAAPPGEAAAADVQQAASPAIARPAVPASDDAAATKVLMSPFAPASGPPAAPPPAKPPKAEAPKVEPPKAEALRVEPPKVEPPKSPSAPRPVTVITTMSALEEAERARLAALATEEAPAGPAPVTLETKPLTVPRQASLPELPVVDDDDLPYGDATEIEAEGGLAWEPSFEPPPDAAAAEPEPTAPEHTAEPEGAAQPWFTDGTLVQPVPPEVLEAALRAAPEDTAGLPSPFDPSDEQAPVPPPRFSDRPVEELFDRSGAPLTPPSLDDMPTATGVPLSSSDEEAPVVAGALLDEPPAEAALAPAPVSAFDIDLQPLEVARAATEPRDDEAPPSLASPSPTEDEEPYVIQPPGKRSGGALGWLAALVVGAGLGVAAAYTYPARPALSPLEQKLSNARDLIGTGRPADAVALLEDVLREQPDHPTALRRLAVARSLAGDTPGAERHYLRYLEVSTDEEDKRAVRALLGLE